MTRPITNTVLAKLFSLEFAASAIIAVWVLGGIWVNINASIASAQATAEQSVAKVAKVEQSVNEIQTDIAVIKTNQANIAKVVDDLSEEVSEQRKDIKKILSILGNGDNRSGD
jgi:septal ring factor EnvC (AmiA/AmiB activator)